METALLDTIPVNSNATPEARELLQYLARCSGTSILTGQHTQTNPMEEYQYIHEVTGHYPKSLGLRCCRIRAILIGKMLRKHA